MRADRRQAGPASSCSLGADVGNLVVSAVRAQNLEIADPIVGHEVEGAAADGAARPERSLGHRAADGSVTSAPVPVRRRRLVRQSSAPSPGLVALK